MTDKVCVASQPATGEGDSALSPSSTQTTRWPPCWRDLACLCLVLLVGLVLWLPRLQGPLDLRYDAGVYYLLGTSLAEGQGYRLLNEPGQPEGIQYPPMLPLFVAVHQKVLGTSDFLVVGPALRLSYFVMSLVLIAMLYLLARQFLRPRYAVLAVLVSTLYYHSYFLSDLLFTELPFALVTVAFILCWLADQRRSGTKATGWITACGVLGAIAFLLRSAGVAVLAGWVGDAVFRRHWKQAAIRLAIALVPLVAWQLHVSRVTASDAYVQPTYEYQRASYQFYNVSYLENIKLIDPFEPDQGYATAGEWVKRVLTNLIAMPAGLGESVSTPLTFWRWFIWRATEPVVPSLPTSVANLIIYPPLLLLGILVGLGAVLLAIRRQWFLPLYIAASIALICLTPWPGQFARYLAPLTPLLAICLALSLARIHAASARRTRPWRYGAIAVTTAALLSITGAGIFTLSRSYGPRLNRVSLPDGEGGEVRYTLFFYDERWAELDEAITWLDHHARPHEVVATSSPHWAHIRTGLPAVMPPFIVDSEEAQRLMDTVPVTYLVVDSLDFVNTSERYGGPVARAFPEAWEPVYVSSSGGVTVYRRTPTRP